jgi:hypothetical protein
MGNTLSLPPARTGKILYFSALEIFFLFLASQLGWWFWCQEMMLSTTSEEVNVWALLDRACLFDEGTWGGIFFFFFF